MPRYLYDDTRSTLLLFRTMGLGGEQEILKSIIISFVFDTFNSRKLASQWLTNIASCWVVVVLRSPIHANEPSEYNGMLYRTSNRVLNNGIKVIILICMDGTSQYHHHQLLLVDGIVIVLNQTNHSSIISKFNQRT